MKKNTIMHEFPSCTKKKVMALAKKHNIEIEEGINTLWADAPDGHRFAGTNDLHSVTAYYDGELATKGQAWYLIYLDIKRGVELCDCNECCS